MKLPLVVASALLSVGFSASTLAACPDFLDQDMRRLHSQETVNLCEVTAGRPVLVVNTASHCGYTPQFKGLEALHQAYKDRGLVVVALRATASPKRPIPRPRPRTSAS
jgi:glutathione peroxidase